MEYCDGGSLKMFRGIVTMTTEDGSPVVRPTMMQFYLDKVAPPARVLRLEVAMRLWQFVASYGPQRLS